MLCIITDLEPLRNHSVELRVLYEGLVDVPDHDVAAEETLPRYQVVQLGLGLVQLAPAAAGHTHALTGAPLGPGQCVHQGTLVVSSVCFVKLYVVLIYCV